VSVVALAALMLSLAPPAATATPAPPARAPQIAVEPEQFDFGRALPERTLSKQFAIRNFGTADLTVDKVSTTCGCTAALLDSKVIKPGGSATLRVTFETRNYAGRVARSVLIKSNDPRHPTLELKLQATVAPEAK
jgi:hypothetical protein